MIPIKTPSRLYRKKLSPSGTTKPKSLSVSDETGYPGVWAIPNVNDAVANSPLSPKYTVGEIIKIYHDVVIATSSIIALVGVISLWNILYDMDWRN